MFGIAGMISFAGEDSAQAIGEAALWMQRCLAPGAARRGLWQRGRVALVHAAPPDGEREVQPVRLIRGACEWVLVYSGPEKARDVLDGYIEWGEAWLAALSGAYALALWRPDDMRLLLACGEGGGDQPLHCARITGGLAFSSEPSALLCLSDWTRVAPAEPLPLGYMARIDLTTRAISLAPI